MLYFASIVQILIYLFIAPLIRSLIDKNIVDYSFFVAIYFLVFFILGGLLTSVIWKTKEKANEIFFLPKVTSIKWYLIIVWLFICVLISLNYGLHNRRIGTESAAELFASISPFYLLIFRSLEISIPLISTLVIMSFFSINKLGFGNIAIAAILSMTVFLLGAGGSRSWIGLISLMILIIMQNKMEKRDFYKLLIISILTSVVVFIVVTAIRISSGDDRDLLEYVVAEVFKRIDGLEIVSQIIEMHGYSLFGINHLSLLNPIISSIPFLEAAIQIKFDALTTVKSVILESEFQSSVRDTNSFILLDVYYWGGLTGVAIVAVLAGFFAKLVDLRIGVTKGWIYQLFLVSVTINLVVLERETIGIFMNTIRDWFILCFVVSVFLIRRNSMIAKISK